MTLHEWTQAVLTGDAAKVGSILAALVGGFRWLIEYIRSNRLKRFEKYQKMAERTDKPPLSDVINSLRKPKPDGELEVAKLSMEEKQDYMAFIEEIAVMKNSRLIRGEVAFYMFGAYAIASKNSPAFRAGFDPWGDTLFWSAYEKFCDDMENLDKKYKAKGFDPEKLRF